MVVLFSLIVAFLSTCKRLLKFKASFHKISMIAGIFVIYTEKVERTRPYNWLLVSTWLLRWLVFLAVNVTIKPAFSVVSSWTVTIHLVLTNLAVAVIRGDGVGDGGRRGVPVMNSRKYWRSKKLNANLTSEIKKMKRYGNASIWKSIIPRTFRE